MRQKTLKSPCFHAGDYYTKKRHLSRHSLVRAVIVRNETLQSPCSYTDSHCAEKRHISRHVLMQVIIVLKKDTTVVMLLYRQSV